MSRRPRASGYFRTGYAQDLALVETRTRARVAGACWSSRCSRFPFVASPFLLDLANQVFLAIDRRAGADAADRLRRPDLARPRRPAGGRRLHRRHPVQGAAARRSGSRCRPPRWSARCSASCSACRRCGCAGSIWRSARWRCISSSSISAASTRPGAASRPASSSTRRRIAGMAHHRRRAPGISSCSPPPPRRCSLCLNLLRARTGRAWRAIRANETVAEALGIGVAALQAARVRRSARR